MLRNDLAGVGIFVGTSKDEWGPGQEEIKLKYQDAFSAADNRYIIRHKANEITFNVGKTVYVHAIFQQNRVNQPVGFIQTGWQKQS
jgi:glutamine synthetase